MSVVNFNLQPDRILVLTDTLGYAGKVPASFGKKIHINRAARTAIATRGPVRVGDFVGEAVEQADVTSFAEASALVLWELTSAYPLFEEAKASKSEATLFMWDDGPRVVRWKMDVDGRIEQFEYAPGVYMAPTLGAHDYPPILQAQHMANLALVQQRIVKKHDLMMCVGGDMHLTTITADDVTVETIGSYPDKAETMAAVARYQARYLPAELAA